MNEFRMGFYPLPRQEWRVSYRWQARGSSAPPHRNQGKFSRLIHCQWKAQPDQKDPNQSSDQPQVAQEEPH